jgi:tetratricopeptide (TPR) repeat protein
MLVLALFLAPGALFADEIFLKGAGSVSGNITQQTPDMVMINTGDGTMGIPTARIQSIKKGRSALDEYTDRAKLLKPGDVQGWKELGRWAMQAGLSTQARQAYQNVIAVSPNDAEAREALGYVQLNGQWLTEEESYRQRGYVKYEGEWMMPAEAQMLQQNSAAEQARRDAEQRANDSAIAAAQAEQKAEEAEKRAKEAEENAQQYSNPVYWGGWGYGTTYWPTGRVVGR